MIDELRNQLRNNVDPEPRRWFGTLRRMAFARAVQASNSIEGYDASLDDVIAAVDDQPTMSADEETRLALSGYRDAMTYVLQVAQDKAATVDEGLLKSLHFMMLKHRLDKDPGRWRPGEDLRRPGRHQGACLRGAAIRPSPELIAGAITELEESDAPVLARAAMAHLNLVMVHPFRDGNGRMARALQTLILAASTYRARGLHFQEYLAGIPTVLRGTGRGWSRALEPAARRSSVAPLLPHSSLSPGEDAASLGLRRSSGSMPRAHRFGATRPPRPHDRSAR